MVESRTVNRVCPFCEATCGLSIEVQENSILSVRGDKEDPFSKGFICPKAHGLKELFHDRDRLRRPVRRTAAGWEEISWADAYEEIAARLLGVRDRHGKDAIGVYSGNPIVHDLAFLYTPLLRRALGSRNVFNPEAIDTLPKIVQTGLMFGGPFPEGVPVPDIDRTKYLLIIGANPAISHGSLMTMPDAPGRLKRIISNGGKLVVIDPRRTETARLASEHYFIRPGTDAAFLLAIVHTFLAEQLVKLGAAERLIKDLEVVRTVTGDYSPDAVAGYCRIEAAVIRNIAREIASAESAACYGRLGTCVQEFGTLACWGVDLINILSGNLDHAGGAMFPKPAAPVTALVKAKPYQFGRWKSRVSGLPESGGRIPSSAMAEEILTPGDGQVRAMILLMTNPLRSAANSKELERAFSQLEYVVAVDFYINESTRYANIILPTASPAEQGCYEFGLYHLSVRNVAKWSNVAVPPPTDLPPAWEVISRLSAIFMGLKDLPIAQVDDLIFKELVKGVAGNIGCGDVNEEQIVSGLADGYGPERIIDLLLRVGPYGDRLGRKPGGLTLRKVQDSIHGIDLGPLEPRLEEVINTASGMIELAPGLMLDDLVRMKRRMASDRQGVMLIGRRTLHTSNSFMHNLPSLVKGKECCTLQVSPADASRIGLIDRGKAKITSRVGSVVAPVELTDDLMPGVVSLPHGWGHDVEESHIRIAKTHPGVNTNQVTDNQAYDLASGTAVLFGTPVTIEPAD